MAREMRSIDEFLKHRTSSRSGGGFLSWKTSEKKEAIVWMHTKRMPIAIAQHKFPKIVAFENKDTGEKGKSVWSKPYNCAEREETIKNQYARNLDGSREFPPTRCGMCRYIEWMRSEVEEGRINWVKPVLRFEGSDPDAEKGGRVVLHAGGLFNAYGKRDLTAEEKLEMKKAKIFPKTAWMENAQAKINYLFCVVDNANPGGGVVIATEAGLLGDKVKELIGDLMDEDALGDKGDPTRFPYAFKWRFLPDAKKFDEKYQVRKVETAITPEIKKLIFGPPPNVTQFVEPANQDTLRAVLEQHSLLKNVPWDDIFDLDTSEEETDEEEAEADADEEEEETPKKASKTANKTATKKKVEDEDEEEEEDEEKEEEEEDEDLVECDECGKAMPASATECPKCGATYEVEEEEKPKKEPLKKRSEIAAAKKKEAAAPPKRSPPATAKKAASKKKTDDDIDEILGDDEIPF